MIDPRQVMTDEPNLLKAMLEEVESHTYAHAPKGRAESAVGYVGKIDLEALKHPNGVGRIVAYAQFDATIPLFATPPARDGAEGADLAGEIKTADAMPPEATFSDGDSMLRWLNDGAEDAGTIPEGFCSPGGKASCLHLRQRERCNDCPIADEQSDQSDDRVKQLAARLIGYVQARPDYSFDRLISHVTETLATFAYNEILNHRNAMAAPPEPPPDAMREANRERQQRIAELKERAAQRCEGCRLSWRLHGWAHGEPMPIECNAKEERQQLRAISAPVPSDDRPLYASPPVRGDRQAVAQANLIRDSIQHTYDEMCVQFSGVHSDDKTDSWLLNLYSSLRLLSLPVQPNLPLGKDTLYTILRKYHALDAEFDSMWQEINGAIEVKP